MKVFADYHHNDLYYSLILLFEERLGWELYRPIGFDWFHEGFWKIAEPYGNAMDTVGQYLDNTQGTWDQYKRLNGQHYLEDNIYHVFDPGHDAYHKAITLETFKSMQFDIIVSSIPAHDISFARLVKQYMPNAKHISQMGNVNQRTNIPNVMHTTPFNPSKNQNVVFYHQEIDRKLYQYKPVDTTQQKIYSMVNLLPRSHYFNQYKTAMLDVEFKAFGASCPDGSLPGTKGVAAKMQEANIGWHIKPQDGFGHTAMGWFASGRPVITTMSDVVKYGHDGPKLFEPGYTCLDIEKRDIPGGVASIRNMLDPETNIRLAEQAYKRFNEVVNYDEEEQQIRKFLEKLV